MTCHRYDLHREDVEQLRALHAGLTWEEHLRKVALTLTLTLTLILTLTLALILIVLLTVTLTITLSLPLTQDGLEQFTSTMSELLPDVIKR